MGYLEEFFNVPFVRNTYRAAFILTPDWTVSRINRPIASLRRLVVHYNLRDTFKTY